MPGNQVAILGMPADADGADVLRVDRSQARSELEPSGPVLGPA